MLYTMIDGLSLGLALLSDLDLCDDEPVYHQKIQHEKEILLPKYRLRLVSVQIVRELGSLHRNIPDLT